MVITLNSLSWRIDYLFENVMYFYFIECVVGCIEAYTSAKNTALRYEQAHYAAHPCPVEGKIGMNE
jgi:hypothetical protein